MGYAGGRLENPTYHSLGDHTETVQVDFSPEEASYAQQLEVFWAAHDPFRKPWSRQYMSLIICADEAQMDVAQKSKRALEERVGRSVWTEIVGPAPFTLAEGYHQKYYLRRVGPVISFLEAVYPDMEDLVNSTAAARLNGYVGGYGTRDTLAGEIEHYGLPEPARAALLGKRSATLGCTG